MDRYGLERSKFDRCVAGALMKSSEQSSRRGFLSRLGKFSLTMLGVATVPVLPVDRVIPMAAVANCSDWHLCGIYGRPCDCCGGTVTTCPPNNPQGDNWWSSCCNHKTINYIDCCRHHGSPAPNCTCGFCFNNTTQPAWCPNDDPQKTFLYTCTIYEELDAC